MKAEVFGLLDANNYYVSCERVFRPNLEGQPVLVLSNNDVCAISRSNECKALQIPMAAPVFCYKDLIEREQIQILSSNYPLYGEFHRRISDTIRSLIPKIEIYSIDESFLHLTEFASSDLVAFCQQVRRRVKRWTGIPTCVGIGPSKTLAKVANWLAKKRPEYGGVCDLRDATVRAELLSTVPLKEVWGIGQASVEKLANFDITTAADLAAFDPVRARRLLTVVGARIVYELRGVSCLPLELLEPQRKGLAVTRSFGRPVTTWREMSEALVTYTMRAGEKLRQHQVAAQYLTVFFHTSAFTQDRWYSDAATGHFLEPTNDTQELVRLAAQLGQRIWRDGFPFAKAGVLLSELVAARPVQTSFLAEGDRQRQTQLWQTVDTLNQKMGRGTVQILGAGLKPAWALRSAHRSPQWTTNWKEIPEVKA